MFAALRFRDFRLLWGGLVVSNLGTWMQFTAMGYFVAQLAGSPHRAAFDLGIIGGARAVPVLLLSPLAGVVADRFPRRRVLLATNLTMSLVAFGLAVLAMTHRLDLTSVMVMSAINAAANAFDAPVRQSWTPLLVERPYVGNAIGLTSVAFNAPAVIGPALAGLSIVWVGVAGSFFANGVATLAVILAISQMASSPPSAAHDEPMLVSIRAGIRFLLEHPVLCWIMGVFVVTAVVVRPYNHLMPAFIVSTLHGGAQELGWAVAAAGVGGFAGALITAAFPPHARRSLQWVIAGGVMSAGVFALSLVTAIPASIPAFFFIGLGTLAFLGASNTLIQMLSPDEMRGRVVSVYTMIAVGMVPLGSLLLGTAASRIGLHLTFAIGGGIGIACVLAAYVLKPLVRRA